MQKRIQKIRQWETPDKIIFVVLLAYFLIMTILLTDYGEAWDNITFYQYAKQTAHIYQQPFEQYAKNDYGPADTRFFGPFLVTAAYFLSKLFLPILPFWTAPVFFRFCYFLTYLSGLVGFYLLGKRYFSNWTSLGATLLLLFQPIFFGQAPLSPKDTTLMSMVIVGVYFAVKMLDHIPQPKTEQPSLFTTRKALQLIGLVIFMALFIIFSQQIFQATLTWIVQAGEGNLLYRTFIRYAPNYAEQGIEGYASRISSLILPVIVVITSLAIVFIATPKKLWEVVQGTGKAFGIKYLIPAGILFGLSVSVRILGVLVGGVLLFLLVFNKPIRTWFFPLTAYTLTALLAMYLTWPYLWKKPIERFVVSLMHNLNHQHTPPVFFNGVSYSASELPVSYVPTFIVIQLTIPLLVLAAAGLVILFVKKQEKASELFVIIGIWFFLPFFYLLISHPQLHGNIRHLFFILPPLFLLAGLSLEMIYSWLKHKNVLYLGLVAALLIPGIVHIVRYHPYEYIYYNTFVGGTAQGITRFEADHLATSLTEATLMVNQIAPENATVFVVGPYNIARNLIRTDINLISRNNNPDLPLDQPDTYIITNEQPGPNSPFIPVYQIMAGDIPLGGVYLPGE